MNNICTTTLSVEDCLATENRSHQNFSKTPMSLLLVNDQNSVNLRSSMRKRVSDIADSLQMTQKRGCGFYWVDDDSFSSLFSFEQIRSVLQDAANLKVSHY